jgi:hypothetical protein
MGDIRGVHRTVSYRATSREQDGQTHWHAMFHYDGQTSEALGSVRNDWSPLADPDIRMHVALQLYIEATLLRGVDELEPDWRPVI